MDPSWPAGCCTVFISEGWAPNQEKKSKTAAFYKRSKVARKAVSIYRKFFALCAEFRLTKAAIPINQYPFI